MNIPSLTVLICALFCVAARSVPEKIESLDQLRKAAVDVEVAAIEFTVPASEREAGRALSERYFNKPLDERFSGVTDSDWKKKWDLLASVLVEKAEKQKLDANSLRACLHTLNHGHTEETMLDIVPPNFTGPLKNEKPEEAEKRKLKDEAEYEAAVKERNEHPDRWESEEVAIPVGAFLGRHIGGSCWMIICVWDMAGPGGMEHVRVWALDTVTHKTIAYVTCR